MEGGLPVQGPLADSPGTSTHMLLLLLSLLGAPQSKFGNPGRYPSLLACMQCLLRFIQHGFAVMIVYFISEPCCFNVELPLSRR